MTVTRFLLAISISVCFNTLQAQLDVAASEALIKRVLPSHASHFIVTKLDSTDQKDVFGIDTAGNKIVLKGNNGVSVASALYYYLTEYCHAQITWNGVNIRMPVVLPKPGNPVRKTSPYQYRYYLNYCTFNYSMAWWDWQRWEKEIDWMALHGINLPLAITGEEYTWYLVYKEMGLTDEELKKFFTGPAYFAWFWMGNIDGWGGPLPLSWMESHYKLQKKILQRQRALGMKPVLPAFTGHVPSALKARFPKAKLKATNWTNGFADTYILDVEDPLFAQIGKKFLQKQTELLGTDHLYSADTFNENEPPSDDPAYLSQLSARVYDGMHEADTAAVWVMQGWLFYSDRKFWNEPQTEALLKAVPDDKMIILDLATEIEPVWKRTDAFYGKPWIWNMIHNFGGNTNLFGRMETVANEPAKALHDPKSGKLKGIGLTMEGIEQNPVMYELMTQHIWQDTVIKIDEWLPRYVRNRYGVENKDALAAWETLRKTAYAVPGEKYIRDGAESVIQARPTFDSMTRWAKTRLNYKATDLLPAWDALVKAADACHGSSGFLYDLVDVTRQVLADYALPVQQHIAAAYLRKDLAGFKKYCSLFTDLINDLDKLLATQKDFLLGPWVETARAWGNNAKEKALYEMNAKDLITLWGYSDCPLHEYSCRQWSGLLKDFYKPRWELFFEAAQKALVKGVELDVAAFDREISSWEWKWVNSRKSYPVKPSGEPGITVKQIYTKYRKLVAAW
ncbi:alpha-N-acetylglucosaminidase [Foetidibacter luteolus]|uniref:alpha-N-acetylglucosaminidase n=1 Tax=Foetidibacter luteolus TaxID=2608880 RepID=UPI00129BED4D|nr:alpha-N-acetylglucosaminidase [Foetidibacter luteolus]